MMNRFLSCRGLLLCGTLLTGLLLSMAPAWGEDAERVLAIGDIHGEFDGFAGILQSAGLIDEELQWIGGTATLVQTGDFLDRGKDVRRVMDLLRSIQEGAEKAGGRVVVLQGNHEQLNLAGELRPEYVTADICAAFATEDSAARREREYETWVEWQKTHTYFEPRSREEWDQLYPLGYFEYVEAIGPQGDYGQWLRTLPVTVKVGSTVFLHGGIGPAYVPYSINKINKLHFDGQEALDDNRRFLIRQGTILPYFTLAELNQALLGSIQQSGSARMSEHERYMFQKTNRDLGMIGRLLDADSPLWFRGYHSLEDEDLGQLVKKLNKSFKSQHYVVAHTVQPSAEIWARLNGSIFLIDTGMLGSHYGGRASALEIIDGRFTAIYPNDRSVLLESGVGNALSPASSRQPHHLGAVRTLTEWAMASPRAQYVGGDGYRWRDSDGDPLPFQSHAEIKDFLTRAKIVEMEDIPVGVTKPKKATLELDGVRAHAAFREISMSKDRQRMADGSIAMHLRDSYLNEVAAYELGLLLGITNIPPAVLREIEGHAGSLQLWVPGTTDKERLAEGKKAPDQVRFRQQVFDMDVFDALINNLDRNQGNILFDDDWNLWMIDHTRSFGRDNKLRKPEDIAMVSQRLYDALNSVDAKQLKAAMKPYMGSFETGALGKRHKELLKLLDKMIEEQGKDDIVFVYE